ncbi:MAG: CHASE2 domain-containing protein [Acidimicrobiia bacterium]
MGFDWLFGGSNKPRAPVVVAFLVLLNALVLRAIDPIGLVRLRDLAFDTFQRIQPREVKEDLGVVIVDIDEKSLAEFGQWPWPRNLVADLVDKLEKAEALVIAFDVVFAEPDRMSPHAIARDLPQALRNSDARRTLEALPDHDDVLAQIIARGRIVTGYAFDANGKGGAPRRVWGFAHNSGEYDAKEVPNLIQAFIPQQSGSVRTIPTLEQAAKGNGFVTTDQTSAIIRNVPLLFGLVGERTEDLFPALTLETLRVMQDASTYIIRWSGAQGLEAWGARTGVSSIRVGEVDVLVDARGRMTLYDSGHVESRFVSAADVLAKRLPTDRIKNHVVFIGTSAVGLKDLRNTPVQSSVPGVEVHAQIIEQIATGVFLERREYANGIEFIYLAVFGLLLVVLLPRLSAARMALVAVMFVILGLAIPWIAFSYFRLLFDPIYPPATLAAIYVSGSALGFMRAERDRREIRSAMSLYLPPDQAEIVARNPDALKLGGETLEITVMFSDVRDFTRMSERLDPQQLTRFMNNFLTPMTDIIQVQGKGTIDKYMGDAIMAFWNAPLPLDGHARNACEAALAMQARLIGLNVMWAAEAKAEGQYHVPVVIGVGLNTGKATVGNFGSQQRIQYSCLGDEVNLASRLEGLCKVYGVGIIIGENTLVEVPDFACIELDLVMVKGKTEPEAIHALVGGVAFAQSTEFGALQKKQAEFLWAYRSAAFAEAMELIDGCEAAAKAAGWSQSYYEMMRERIDGLIDDSPPDWTGVYVAREK